MSSDAPPTLDELRRLNEQAETEAEFEFIEKQVAAIVSAATDTAGQRQVLDNLTQPAAAYLIGMSTRKLLDHPLPRNATGSFNGPEVVRWHVSRSVEKARKEWEKDSDRLKTAEERKAEAQAVKYEEQAKSLQDQYVLKDDVQQLFSEMAAAVRQELESIPKAMMNDFPEEHREKWVRELTNHLRQVLRRLAARGSRLDHA